MSTRGAVLVALAAAMGNLLQGWDNATIAGAVLYIKKEFHLQSQPTMEGLLLAMSLIGATVITTFSGSVSDAVGRRPMLILSSVLYCLGGFVMFWSPNVYVLLIGRLLDGFGVGLAVTLVPLYISETSPTEIRGQLNTFPQFTGCVGMFLSYCMVFGMSLEDSPSWRLMLGVLSIPSLIYFVLAVFFLPESPRWLVSKGQMKEAKRVLQRLRGREDVSGEMALLVEGLSVGGDASIEEYIIGPDNELNGSQNDIRERDQIKLYGAEEGVSWIAKPVTGQSNLGLVSRRGSIANQSTSLIDPMVTLFGSVHEKTMPQTGSMLGSMRSMLLSNFGSMFNVAEQHKNEQWDEESQKDGDQLSDAGSGNESDDNLRSPLLAQASDKDVIPRASTGSFFGQAGEQVSGMGIGGGWQIAYRKDEKTEKFKRIYLHEEGAPGSRRGSVVSLVGRDITNEGEYVHASALVSQSVLRLEDIKGENPIKEAIDKPVKSSSRGPGWRDLLEPGVKHALIVGIGIQILQQFSGINGVLYYTPQILKSAGVGVLLSNLGLSPDSASILISSVTTLLMLPSIGVAMKLMDIAGRRLLLLTTLPVLLISLILLVLGNVISMGETIHAIISTICVVVYFCCFVMGFGPIPNILCSEIFPTRVRGLCIAICALVFWFGDIIVTYSLPVMLNSIGLAGVFGIYAVVCFIAWWFVFLKVPETKGMPLEVITEFFAVGAKQSAE
ncbi:hypothetical protein M9H77_05140 [Catharanthus roseus]|uniref:Uncharacterized protein n=1 Tax=Catharanthus roseus TaxID=4058 RepID=A0ACC0CGD9_CATRO|nr:hypothetical protein M9H77_05140 [Catharanthus roseus]